MQTRDRVRLDADVYRPNAPGQFPVLLMRQPYGRAIASTVVYAHPVWYAAHGFLVIIQDVRGRGTSEGEFRLFEHETHDGDDTVEWAAHLPHSNGQVGMYGFSYQGMTQLFAAEARPPALKAIAPAMVGYHPYADWAYENGALLLQAGLGWAIQLAAETARLRGDREAFQALYRASRQLPWQDPAPACPDVLTRFAPDSFFHDWLQHPQPDDYWAKITPNLDAIDLPMLHIGGWFDPYLRGDLRLYQEIAKRSQHPQPLRIGPWGHIPWGRRVGGRDFGSAANSPIDRLQVNWFSHQLNGPAQLESPPSQIQLFEMGSDRWRNFATWPSGNEQRWRLTSDGLAAMRQDAGQLLPPSRDLAAESPSGAAAPTVMDTLVHDPWRPVPALGGHAAMPAGPFDRASLDCRSDVLTYTSEPLTEALAVAGQIEAGLRCCSDRPSFDLSLTLSAVHPDGAVYPFTQGYGRFQARVADWQTCRLRLHPTCFVCRPGYALRLSISAANFPAYPVNPGTGDLTPVSAVIDAHITTVDICCNHRDTYLVLPVNHTKM